LLLSLQWADVWQTADDFALFQQVGGLTAVVQSVHQVHETFLLLVEPVDDRDQLAVHQRRLACALPPIRCPVVTHGCDSDHKRTVLEALTVLCIACGDTKVHAGSPQAAANSRCVRLMPASAV
jgi:hypothetical protein